MSLPSTYRRVSFHPANTDTISDISVSSADENGANTLQSLSIRGLTNKEERILSCLEFLDRLDDEEYVICVEVIVCDRKHLQLENQVLKEYLKVYEPNMIADMVKVNDMIRELERHAPLMPSILGVSQEPDSPMAFMFSELGSRLNVSLRSDLLMRFMEEMEASLGKFSKHAIFEKCKYNAAIEESSIRLAEVETEREDFDAAMDAAVDPVTTRIPAEKFVHYMENNLKRARQTTERYRLRNNSLKSAYTRAKTLLEQKRELGTTLHEVDFEQYIIENLHLLDKIDQGNTDVAELKQRTGHANLTLTLTKTDLKMLLDVVRNIQGAIEKCQVDQMHFAQESEETLRQITRAEEQNQSVKTLIGNSRVPEPLEYLRVKARLSDLQKTQKVLTRKENLQNITMNTTTKMMKQLTGSKKVKKEWFDKYALYKDELDEDDREFGAVPSKMYALSTSSSNDIREFDIFQVIQRTPPAEPPAEPEAPKRVATQSTLKRRKFSVKRRKTHTK